VWTNDDDWTWTGKVFQTMEAATWNMSRPMVVRRHTRGWTMTDMIALICKLQQMFSVAVTGGVISVSCFLQVVPSFTSNDVTAHLRPSLTTLLRSVLTSHFLYDLQCVRSNTDELMLVLLRSLSSSSAPPSPSSSSSSHCDTCTVVRIYTDKNQAIAQGKSQKNQPQLPTNS